MKILSTALVLLSSSKLHLAAGSGIRGSGQEIEEGTKQNQWNRDLAKNGKDNINGDQGSGLFGGQPGKQEKDYEIPDVVKPIEKPSVKEDENDLRHPIGNYKDPLPDVKVAAKMLNLSLDDTQELLKQQQDFAKIVDDLQDDINFLQAEMPSEPNGEFVLKYKNGEIPKKSQEGIQKFMAKNKKAKVKSVSAKLSLKDAEDRGQRLAKKLEGKGYSQVSFSIDGDEIEVVAKKPRGQAKGKDNGKAPAALSAKILDLKANDSDLEGFTMFLVEDEGEDPSEPQHTYGGRKISASTSGGGQECTTAFSVRSLGAPGITPGTPGIATAGHCVGMEWYDAVSPESNYRTYRKKDYRGTWGDFEWHTTSHSEPAEFYMDPRTRARVTSIANSISKNQAVCSYSRKKGKLFCSKVKKTSHSVNWDCCPRISKLVVMEENNMVDGDSGGPWFVGNRAYGIHSGRSRICDVLGIIGCNRHDVWSRVAYLETAIGVTVRTD